MKQVLFYDKSNDQHIGGILLENGDVVCGCCGGIIPKDEIDVTGEDENCNYIIIQIYPYWVDLSETIIGDDLDEDIEENE